MIPPERLAALQADWIRVLGCYGVSPARACPPLDVLIAAYSAPERHYHNLEHLADMFRVVDRLDRDALDANTLRLAVWFHDAVYDPRARNNEMRSGELAVDLLGPAGLPARVIDRVVQLVWATALRPTTPPPGDRDASLLADADLAVLGSAPDRYRRYAADIRREYGFLSDTEYRRRRVKVLRSFLARPRIYQHPVLFAEPEQQARANIVAELAVWGELPPGPTGPDGVARQAEGT